MSKAKPRSRRMCQDCGDQAAKYFSAAKGRWRHDLEHDLCPRCSRAMEDSSHARRVVEVGGLGLIVARTGRVLLDVPSNRKLAERVLGGIRSVVP